MTVAEMHYDFKKKLNKGDSQQQRNFTVPEIDWVLNEAAELFVKIVAEPRAKAYVGFELTQRATDNISPLVVADRQIPVPERTENGATMNLCPLPNDYVRFIRGTILSNKRPPNGISWVCPNSNIVSILRIRQFDDEFENSPFDDTSVLWQSVNGVFTQGGILLMPDKDGYTHTWLNLTYRKKLPYFHYASGFSSSGYNKPGSSGTGGAKDCVGTVQCILPEDTHREIVDLAVLIAAGEIGDPNYQIKAAKVGFNLPAGASQQQPQRRE